MIILMNMIWKLLIMLDLWLDIIDLSNGRHVSKELMLVVWHPTRQWDGVSEDEKKEIELF